MLPQLLVGSLLAAGPALGAVAAGAAPAAAGAGAASRVPVGEIITKCTVPNTFALTFDDGPHIFTETLRQELDAAGVKATFFVNGMNFGNIADKGDLLRAMMADGHQIGSHTFDHPDLATISDDEKRSEMLDLENALAAIQVPTPTYMRPPFFSTNDDVLRIMRELNYHVINADIDTKDFENTTPETNDVAFTNFKNGFSAGTISLMHDVHNTTVNQLVPNVLRFIKDSGRQFVTVGSCLGDPPENWYQTRSGGQNGSRAGGQTGGRAGGSRRGKRSQSPGYNAPKTCGCSASH